MDIGLNTLISRGMFHKRNTKIGEIMKEIILNKYRSLYADLRGMFHKLHPKMNGFTKQNPKKD